MGRNPTFRDSPILLITGELLGVQRLNVCCYTLPIALTYIHLSNFIHIYIILCDDVIVVYPRSLLWSESVKFIENISSGDAAAAVAVVCTYVCETWH